ncbi:MAG: phosphatidylserine decarboxylase [Acidobacteriota bacterium]|nr:MAG: phosphatidylserine decarboxylase [Acidobacteriota bacterium]
MRLAKEAWPFVAVAAAGSFIGLALGLYSVGIPLALLAAAVAFFFRDPERRLPEDADTVVSPADGTVVEFVPKEGGTHQIGVFLAPWNVHVNRVPYNGSVSAVRYQSGKFLAAFRQDAGLRNERNRVELATPLGTMAVTQVAGWIARRIVCRLKEGDRVSRGERMGLIQFGSRVECELPPTVTPLVKEGDVVRGGETVIGRAKGGAP